ncbi:MAG TPA: type II secretion system protein [Candidatus Colwellbacteria bacterium]|jgi:prepilin-type N-terminal cleavage/methylation domain-containing protein|nr:type II secretion system protein [Candidatus Colwellbacteria bacterium]
MKSQKGFTLIEMVIVIAVIGILMGLVFNGTRSVQSNARDTRRMADLKKVQTYLELYYNRCGHYPGGATCSPGSVSAPASWDALKDALVATVADEADIPDNDPSGEDYRYGVNIPRGFEYVLGARMERGVPVDSYEGALYGLNCGPDFPQDNLYCVR